MTRRLARIRMYNVGFGDCFLVRFEGPEGTSSVLIDCGVHSASKSKFTLDAIVAAVQDDITNADNRQAVDVVVVTHRHRDHVHGFRNGWDNVAVQEVWMPWTEHPTDPDARRIRNRQSAGATALTALFATQPGDSTIRELVGNSLTNEQAMTTLHSGFAGAPARYFLPPRDPADERAKTFTTPALPGVTVHVLGPARDERAIRDMNPPDTESYLRLNANAGDLVEAGSLPFARWRMTPDKFQQQYGYLNLKHRGDVVNAGAVDAYTLAVGLEQAVNGTSLMLMFEFGSACLLFSGDAQWGTWDQALHDPDRRDLLARTTFYKVGHHGSHNATPREFIEQLLHGASAALVSVAPTGIPSWHDIPRPPLLEALAQEGRCELVIRSDLQAPTASNVKEDAAGRWVEIELEAR